MNELEIEVFRSGDYGEKGAFSEKDVDQLVSDYDPSVHEAPITIDHAQSGPALGWVDKLYKKGNKIIAKLKDLNEKFLDLLKKGAFKKRSIELYKKFDQTGRPYLRAVSFLGAKPPEVKGLADIQFSEKDNLIQIEFAEDENTAPNYLQEILDTKREVEEKIIKYEESRKNEEIISFCENMKSKGKFLPAWENMGIVAFMQGLDEFNMIQFSEEKLQTPLAWFKNFLRSIPEIIPMGEADLRDNSSVMSLDSIPEGTTKLPVSPESIELHKRVVAFQEGNKGVSYCDALKTICRK